MTASQASGKVFESFFKTVLTLQAHFDQEIVDEQGLVIEATSGTFYLSRPNKFRWNYTSTDTEFEEGKQTVSDGESIYIYDPDFNVVTKYSAERALESMPILLLTQTGESIGHHFDVNELGVINGLVWVGLMPKNKNAVDHQLKIAFLDGELNAITFTGGSGFKNHFSLSAVKSNLELSQGIFDYSVPKNADLHTK